MIRFEHTSFTYSSAPAPALADLSLDIDRGEFVLVVGPSGSGKSTLLRCINGLVPHFSGGRLAGRVLVNGLDTRRHAPADLAAHVGFVFQEPETQFVTERVEDELAFAMENLGVPPLTMRKRVEEVLDLLGIAHLRRRTVSSLSGGEQQRVAIASALALQPQALLLDEPTSQLDPLAAEEVLAALDRLNDDLGLTIVLSEHRLERVIQHADRVIYLNAAGAPALIGSPREVMAHIELAPPVTALGKALNWNPLPLTVKDARRFVVPNTKLEVPSAKLEVPSAKFEVPRTAPSLRLPHARSGQSNFQSPISNPHARAAGSPAFELRNVSYAYGDRAALRNVSMQVGQGEFVALMGRNGSGKTTLLKCAVGLLKPQSGQVRVLGEDICDRRVDEIAQRAGYVPQNPGALLFADSVRDELRFTLKNHGLENESVDDLLAALGLESLAGAYPRDLSAGERQRAALASIVVVRPSILLLDEPTRGLDYENKARLVEMLKRWQRQGASIVLVTHDVELVARAADRVALMAEGEIVVDGPAREVLGESAIFSTQINKLFAGAGLLTVEDAVQAMRAA
ncbi:MAG TPA: ABC transporter ATP-binding protein [Anaerolineae bacterium]|nr:ABC transporter ATP-binding protein [Anaerolineae bacterium]